MSSPITTHVLNTVSGKPAVGVPISLEKRDGDHWIEIGSGVTSDDGRIGDLMAEGSLEQAHYRMNFATESYFSRQGIQGFYPVVRIEFEILQLDEHYHVPLLLSPFGYSTYRGS